MGPIGVWAGGGAPVQRRIPEGKCDGGVCEENLRYIWLTGQCALHLADEETGPEMLEERFG